MTIVILQVKRSGSEASSNSQRFPRSLQRNEVVVSSLAHTRNASCIRWKHAKHESQGKQLNDWLIK